MLPYAELLSEIGRLSQEGATGTLFVRTDEEHTARFAFQNGRIVGVAYRVTRGVAAFPLIRKIKRASVEFTPGVVFTVGDHESLPSTPQLLGLLGGAPVDAGKTRAAIETLLIEFTGDAATRIMEDVVGSARLDSTAAWQTVIERLALELDAGEVREFIARAKKILGI